jgi:S-adenosylmethionine hydrolase
MLMNKPGTARPIIALLTDFGSGSFYVGAMKGAVLFVCPQAAIVDITHEIRRFAIEEGSFVLARALEMFPEGTAFAAVVDPGVGGERKNLIFEVAGRFIVAPDNGLISDVAAEWGVDRCRDIDREAVAKIRLHRAMGGTFLGRDVFAPAAGAVAVGGLDRVAGSSVEEFLSNPPPRVELTEGTIKGTGRYIDGFGNIITNITTEHIVRVFGADVQQPVRVAIGARTITGVHHFYSKAPAGTLTAVLNSWNLLELSVNRGSAAAVLGCSDPREATVTVSR